jgi:zinc/manganese transport system substrate-binding protein
VSAKRLPAGALCAAAVAAALGGCGSAADGNGSTRVVATTTQAADLTRNVAGPGARVRQILAANVDPHEYEPRPSDALGLSHAKLVVRSGGDVDSWLGGLIRSAGGGAPVLTLAQFVRPLKRKGELDPHWWQDPRNAEAVVRTIARRLSAVDPANRALYSRNAAAYERRLRRLDAGVAACIRLIPRSRRKLVTDHDALGYFARRYGLQVIGTAIPSLSTQAEASAGDVAHLVRLIRAEHVRAIFPESSLSPKLERAIAKEAGASVGGELWADSLGPRGSSGATYLGSIRANAESIASGLLGRRVACSGG